MDGSGETSIFVLNQLGDDFFRSGDLVSIDNEGFHAIVGREKDLIITAGGENIAPQPIHDLVKEQLPVISQVSTDKNEIRRHSFGMCKQI